MFVSREGRGYCDTHTIPIEASKEEHLLYKAPSDTGRHIPGVNVLPNVTNLRADTGVLTITVKGVVDGGSHLVAVATGDLIPIYLGTMGPPDRANENVNAMTATLDNEIIVTIGG